MSSSDEEWRPAPIIREGDLYRERKIHQIDPQTGAILRTITSDRGIEHLIERPQIR
jgi:hypothetical protein